MTIGLCQYFKIQLPCTGLIPLIKKDVKKQPKQTKKHRDKKNTIKQFKKILMQINHFKPKNSLAKIYCRLVRSNNDYQREKIRTLQHICFSIR